MGLDMYLYRKSYLAGNDEWIKPEYRTEVSITVGGKPIDASKVKYVIEEVAYWRKANQIHGWFVKNVQNGNDDCRPYPVSAAQLLELKAECETVLDNVSVAEEVLPTQSGFFFGNTNYDEDYITDLEDTVNMIDRALENGGQNADFEYVSSW